MSWRQGHATIVQLVNRGHLEQISGQAANGDYLIGQARQRIASANSILQIDRVGAYNLAYDGTRQAATALLIQQGLRPRVEGGHVAIDADTAAEAVAYAERTIAAAEQLLPNLPIWRP
jgi:ABC-type xylose transport system substrate-binding protein